MTPSTKLQRALKVSGSLLPPGFNVLKVLCHEDSCARGQLTWQYTVTSEFASPLFRALTLHMWWPLGSSTTWNCTDISCSRGMKFSLLQKNQCGSLRQCLYPLTPPQNCEKEVRPPQSPLKCFVYITSFKKTYHKNYVYCGLVTIEQWLKALLLVKT